MYRREEIAAELELKEEVVRVSKNIYANGYNCIDMHKCNSIHDPHL